MFGVVVDGPGQGGLEAGEVGAALAGVDVVRERVDGALQLLGRLHRDLDVDVVVLVFEVDDLVVDRRPRLVEVADELPNAALVAERLLVASVVDALLVALVDQGDGDAGVEERQLTQAAGERRELEGGGLEDLLVGPKSDVRARLFVVVEVANALEAVLGGLAAGELVTVDAAVAFHLDLQPLGEGVDDADADAVESPRDLVGLGVELPAGVENGHDHFERRAVVLLVDVDRDPSTVVADADGVVVVDRDRDIVAVPRERLIDGVVDDLVDEMVEPPTVRGPDIHRRTFTDGLQAFEDLDLAGSVFALL